MVASARVRALKYAFASSRVLSDNALWALLVIRSERKTTDNQLINQWVNFDRSALRLARRKLETLFRREVSGKFRDFRGKDREKK